MRKIMALWIVMLMMSLPVSALQNDVTVRVGIPDDILPLAKRQIYGWINLSTGGPVSNSQVYFEDQEGSGASNSTNTDATGYYSLDIEIAHDNHYFVVYGINNTCLLNMTDWWLPDSDFQLNIDMEPAPPRDCSIRGYLRDAVNGFGLSGETLTAISDTYMNWTTTNGSGFYNMSFIPEKYGMGAESDGYEGTSLNFKLESGRHIWRNISLEPLNCYLRGFIKDDGGAPISGANVGVREPWDRDYNNFTDPAGYYELNLTRGTKSVGIRASGCLWNSGTAEMTSGNITWLNVTMVPFPAYEFTLRGYVEEYNTTDPVNNTEVRLRADLQNGTWSNSTFTDATGYYEIMAPAFDLKVTAIGENHMENGTVVKGIAGQTIWQNITITNNTDWATLSGNVTLDGTPAQWANIAGTYWSETYWSPTYGTSSDAAGEYILNLPAGYVEVTCSAEKSNIERVSFELKPNEVFWYDFSLSTLEFDSIMLGKVTDQIGDPVQNSFFYFMNDMRSQTFSTVGITDFNGTYEVAVPRGELIYISFTEDYKVEAGTVDITQEWNWFNLSLTPLPGEVMVRGYLRSVNMVPIPGQQMSASMVDPLGDSHSWWMDMYWFNQPTSNLTGYYEFSAPKGEVSLVLTYVDGYYGLSGGGGLSVDTSSGTDIWQNFTLRPRPCFSEIWGKVKQSDETNVSGALVTAIIGSREFTAFTDLNGNYTLNVPEGALKISARKNGFGCIDTQYIYLYQSGQLEWVNMTLDPASAWLELPITDSVVDLDGDGKHDWLYVNVTVNVSNPGNYMISGTLKSTRWITGDGMESSEVGRTANETSLDAGVHTVRLAFNGPSLYLSEMDGYYVEVELRESQDWQSLDRRGQQISKYSWTDFDVPDVEIVDPCHTFGPVDTDFDGLYNMLLFNTTVNVLAPGNYTFMGQIMNLRTDENYEPFENIMIFEELQAGINTIEFDFSGTRIFNSGCHLGMVSVMIFNGSVDMSGGNIIGMSQVYVPYNYTKFQHYPIDSLVYGWVNDTTNTPIANISVELYNITHKYLNETRTNSSGYYDLGGWEGDWLLVMDDCDETDGEYQGNLTTITLNAATPLIENRTLQDPALDAMTRNIIFDANDWNKTHLDQIVYAVGDNETLRYDMDVHGFGNGDGFISEEEVDMLLGFVGSQVQIPANLSDYMTVDNITYDLDAGSDIFDLGLVGSVTSKEPVYIHQKANYTANSSIPAPSPHYLELNVEYDDTDMGSITESNCSMICYVQPPAGWGRTTNETSPNVTISGSDYITVDPGPDPDPFDGNITEWVNITISDSVAPTTGSVAGNVTLAGRSRHDGVTVKVLNITTGAEVSRGVTDQYGSYYIPGIANGTYNITAEKGGYGPNITIDQVVTAGETTWVPDMTLYSYPPMIFNVQYQSVVMNDTEIYIYADVTDDGEVGNVTLQYKNVSGSNFFIQMDNIGQNTYQATIPAQVDTGLVEFNITANDTVGNSVTTGTYNITISGGVPPASYDIDLTGFSVGDWAFISFPITASGDVETVFNDTAWGDGGTQWDYIQWYDANDHTDHWKTYATFKPASLNDMPSVTNKMGFWIHLTANDGDKKLTIGEGYEDASTSINLYAGWNLVGYPTMNLTTTTSNAFWGIPVDKVEVFDPAEPYRIREVGPDYVMNPGEGYWVHVPVDTVWVVDW